MYTYSVAKLLLRVNIIFCSLETNGDKLEIIAIRFVKLQLTQNKIHQKVWQNCTIIMIALLSHLCLTWLKFATVQIGTYWSPSIWETRISEEKKTSKTFTKDVQSNLDYFYLIFCDSLVHSLDIYGYLLDYTLRVSIMVLSRQVQITNPVTPGALGKNMFFGHFQPGYKLNYLQSTQKGLWQCNSLPFLPPSPCFMTFLLLFLSFCCSGWPSSSCGCAFLLHIFAIVVLTCFENFQDIFAKINNTDLNLNNVKHDRVSLS